jgi:hypothetical protein
MFDDRALESRTVAVGRIVNTNDPTQVRIVVASSKPGQLTPQRPLIQGSPGYDYVPSGQRYGNSHAEIRILNWANENLGSDEVLQAIGVSHPAGICPCCYLYMQRRGVTPASPLAHDYYNNNPRRGFPQPPSEPWILSSWGWLPVK